MIKAMRPNTGPSLVDSHGHESSVASQQAVVSVLSTQFASHERISPEKPIEDD